MVEYVYAIHDFIPENDDEVPFRAGERIEIVERDDLYGDGWWQGRNLAGRVGLFPQNYTQPAPTVTPTPPEAVSQGPEHSSSTPAEEPHPLEPSTSAALLPLMEEPEPSQSTGKATPKGEVMRATLTDVQKAIEQLGERTDADGARSFSFSSVRDGDTTDHDTGEDSDAQEGDDWYKATRQKLAERAREQVEEARAREVVGNRASIPPIDVDISDESGDEEEDGTRKLNSHRSHPHIPEEDEEAEGKSQSASSPKRGSSPEVSPAVEASDQFIVPSPLDALPDLPTATQMTFPPSDKPAIPDTESASPSHFSHTTALLRPSDILLNPDLPKPSESIDSSTQMPNYAGKDVGPTSTTTPLASPAPSSHMHVASSTSTSSSTKFVASSPLSQSQTFQDSMMSPSSSALKRPGSHPTDWTVEEVVDWLKSRGFDDSVCDKFTEQEITGDVLLELDVNVLKSEIGIIAFGKRMRIANAIADLRRPPSVMSENPPLSASLLASSPGPGTSSPFRSHSQSQSVVTATTHHSSPYTPTSMQRQFTGQNGEAGDIQGRPRRDSDPGIVADSQATLGTAVDLVSSRSGKARPSQLTLSPSDSALGSSIKAISGDISGSADSDRGVLSESEAVADSRLRKSPTKGAKSQSSRTDPGEGADGSSPTQHARKRSTDTSKPPSDRDRHSLFGGAFTSTLGRSRKPPPRYSGAEAESPEKGGLSFSRLVPGGSRKSSGRPQTADGTASATTLTVVRDSSAGKRDSRDSGNSKERKDPALLRKRTSSAAGSPVSRDSPVANSLVRDRAGAAAATLKAGQSILQQIGAPDHNGWMRKKGERYNAWKNRYFVLKGPHLYWLRSNSPTEIRIKGYVNTTGYRIIADEKIDPGKYGFKLIHETEKSHLFSSDEQSVIREWMKALMKAAIDRDYTKPVISSVNIPTIPLAVAQAMNPAPRPPSPTARAATQKALRRENTNQLSTRDAQVLMGSLPSVENGERTRLESVFSSDTAASVASINSGMSLEDSAYVSAADASKSAPPSRPSRELRRLASTSTQPDITLDPILAEWVNSHVPRTLQLLGSSSGPLCIGLTLLRLAESIKGSPASPPVSDAAFPSNPNDDKLEGLFRLFDFLLDNDVRMGSVSINDIRQGRRDKVIQLLKALRSWEDKRRALTRSIGKGGMTAGGFVASVGWEE